MPAKKKYVAFIEVTGAYGRTYTKLNEAKLDWLADKDFRSTIGPYVNMTDAERYLFNVVLRYGKNNEKLGTLR